MDSNSEKLSLQKLEKNFFDRKDVKGDYDLNYCIPINVGVISQGFQAGVHGKEEITNAVGEFGKRLQKLFGRFSGRSAKITNRNDSRIQLTLYALAGDTSELTRMALDKLIQDFNASVRTVGTLDEIKEKCWLVLALWDGIATGEIYGSVKEILSYTPKKSEGKKREYRMRFPKNRPVYQIVLPVAGGFPDDQKARGKVRDYSIRDIYPRVLEKPDDKNVWYDRYSYSSAKGNDSRRSNFLKSARKMKNFNAAVLKYAARQTGHTENVHDLLPEYRGKITPSIASDTAVLRQICYDVISMKSQLDHRFDLTAVLGFACLGLVFFSMYSDFYQFKPFIYIFIALFALAYVFYFFGAKLMGNQNYYLEFRALAECMRVQCYWYTAGIDESVGEHYSVKFNKDMSWANYALDRWHESDTTGNRVDYRRKDDDLICREWLCNQRNFFSKSAEKNRRNASLLSAINGFSKVLWIAAAVALAFILWNGMRWENFFIFAIGIINIVTLSLSYLNEKLTYKELVAKYTYCRLLAQNAIDDIASGAAEPKEIFLRFGEEALEENAEWLMIENDREPDVANG